MTPADDSKRPSRAELLVLLHVGVLLLGAPWAFGGNIGWARLAICLWATAALPLTAFLASGQNEASRQMRRRAWWLLPPALYAVLVVASTFNPSFQPLKAGETVVLVHRGSAHAWLPGTASAAASLDALWLGAGVYLSAFNLCFVRGRAALRGVLMLAAANTLALSIFGTLQTLSGRGFYFGAAESPNKRYFATFIYNNHWGAFMLVALAVAIGLLFYHARRARGRDLWHSPFTAALLGVLVIAVSAPVSASRAATGMTALLLAGAVAVALVHIVRIRRRHRHPVWPPVAALLVCVLAATSAAAWLGFRSINERYVETRAALHNNQSLWSDRADLYRDTWELVAREPVFGWGLNTYDLAFQLVRPRPLQPERQYEGVYHTAHNDWLQSLAETGFAGTLLLLLTAAVPLVSMSAAKLRHPLVGWPLAGLGIVLLYAMIEFPFSNAAFLILFWTGFFTVVRYARLLPDERDSGS